VTFFTYQKQLMTGFERAAYSHSASVQSRAFRIPTFVGLQTGDQGFVLFATLWADDHSRVGPLTIGRIVRSNHSAD
jgi:hypothetical protein